MALRRPELITLRRCLGNLEPIPAQLCENDGTPIDVSANTIVCRIVNRDTGAVVVNNAATVAADATTGQIQYQPVAADVDEEGTFAVYFIDESGRRWPYEPARYLLVIEDETGTD